MAFSVVLFDNSSWRNHLLPLVATRPVANLRVGALTLDEKWRRIFQTDVSYQTASHLNEKFVLNVQYEETLLIHANVLPSTTLITSLKQLEIGQFLVDQNGVWVAGRLPSQQVYDFCEKTITDYSLSASIVEVDRLNYPEDIFLHNAAQIEFDINCCIDHLNYKNGHCFNLSNSISENVLIHQSVRFEQVQIDSSRGLVLIDEGAFIEPNVFIQGPAVIGANARVKSGAVIYSNVTIGPHCTVGGEINNSVIWGNSSKGHEGYLGCSVLGEGCNLGAGTTNSNLKNDWSSVKLYDYVSDSLRDTNLLKCGVIIGDHAMLGILSKINTGTVIGVGAQVAMSAFLPKFIPDFSWFTEDKRESYIFARFIDMIKRKASIKKEMILPSEIKIFEEVYEKWILLTK